METKIIVIGLPSFKEVVKEAFEALEKPKFDLFHEKRKSNFKKFDFERPIKDFGKKCKCGCNEPKPWGIAGKPADENLRFGAEFAVDEPRKDEFFDWDDFLEAREAFDDFVTAGEKCVDLGLERPKGVNANRCNATRKPIGTSPVTGKDLIGESQFPWWEEPSIIW